MKISANDSDSRRLRRNRNVYGVSIGGAISDERKATGCLPRFRMIPTDTVDAETSNGTIDRGGENRDSVSLAKKSRRGDSNPRPNHYE